MAPGVAVGLLLALLIGRVLASVLYGQRPVEPATLAAVMAAAALLASWLPARRAARVDPMVALRND